ncbi:MAG: hypothetical protein ACTSPB_13340 [Candidatus Thorarchaeota archaeon]
MVRVSDTAVDYILAYFWLQGGKAGRIRKIGPDMADYLISKGHTFSPRAEKKLRTVPSASFSTSVSTPWTSNAGWIAATFGESAYNIDAYYTRNLPTGRSIELGIDPMGSPGGGKGRAWKATNFNQTGWDVINIESIVNTNKPDPRWIALLNNVAVSGGASFTADFPVTNPRYEIGSGLMRYAGTPPAISGAPTPTTGATPPPTPTTPAVEPVVEPEPEPVVETVDVSFDDFKDNLSLDDLSVFVVNGANTPTIKPSDRKISSKAFVASAGKFSVESGQISITMRTPDAAKLTNDLEVAWITGEQDPSKLFDMEGDMVTITDEEGEEYEVPAPPKVKFIVDCDEKKVFISVNGEMIQAIKDESEYAFAKCEITVEEPAKGGKITSVFLDGSPIEFGKKTGAIYDYGFPIRGVMGLPENCYADAYDATEVTAGKDPTTQMFAARGKFYALGGRLIQFGTPQSYTYDMSQMDEKVLQPLALNFDTELDLDKQGIFFTLLYQNALTDGSNLFPGFDINSTVDANMENLLFPNDVRNLRPKTEDNKVMLQKAGAMRRAGEGIEKIEIDSSNLQNTGELEIGGKTYTTEVYSQVQVTFDGGDTMLIPDGDDRFRAIDNSDSEIMGTISVDESTERPQIQIISGDLDDIYESLEASRRSNRLSKRFNRESKGEIVSQTGMVKQGDSYYIIMGVGSQTVVVELDMEQKV